MSVLNPPLSSIAVSKPQNWFEMMAGVFVNPRKTFENLVVRPTFIFPLLVMAVVVIVCGLFTKDIMTDYMLRPRQIRF